MSRRRAAREGASAKEAVLAALAPYQWSATCREAAGRWAVWLPRGDGGEGTLGSGASPQAAWGDALVRIRQHGVPSLRTMAGF